MNSASLFVKLLLGAVGAVIAVVMLSLLQGDPVLRALPVLAASALTGAFGLLFALRVYRLHGAIRMPAFLMGILAVLVYGVGIFTGFAIARGSGWFDRGYS